MRREEADLVRKLNAVRDFLAAYGENPIEAPQLDRVRTSSPQAVREKAEITSFTEQTRRSVLLSIEAMGYSNGLIKTKQLVEYVESRGHEISGKNKVNALGALLARSADVVGHGKSGWDVVDRAEAIKMLERFEYKEKEPSSEDAVGSDAGQEGAATPNYPWNKPSNHSAFS